MAKKAKAPAGAAGKKSVPVEAAKERSARLERPKATSAPTPNPQTIGSTLGAKRTYYLTDFAMPVGSVRPKTAVLDAGFRRGRIWV
jgi:hypothetical protein